MPGKNPNQSIKSILTGSNFCPLFKYERIFKIGVQLPKLWAKNALMVFHSHCIDSKDSVLRILLLYTNLYFATRAQSKHINWYLEQKCKLNLLQITGCIWLNSFSRRLIPNIGWNILSEIAVVIDYNSASKRAWHAFRNAWKRKRWLIRLQDRYSF